MMHLDENTVVPRTGQVAVKSLLPSAKASPWAIADFKAEVAVLSKLSHSCLVKCIGTGTRPDPKVRGTPSRACTSAFAQVLLALAHSRATRCYFSRSRRSRAATCATWCSKL